MEFRRLTLDDLQSWAGLLALTFERTPEQMEKLILWFHQGFELVTCGAWDNGELVAQYNCRLARLQVPRRSEPVDAGMGLNMAVHPNYRGQGLLDKVSRPVYDIITQRGWIAGVGFSNVGGINVTRKSRNYQYQVLGKMASTLIWFSRRHYPEPLTLTDRWSVKSPLIPLHDDGYIRYAFTLESIRHRFYEHPFRRYSFGLWNEGENTRGIVIFRRVRRGSIDGAGLLAVYGDDIPSLLGRWVSAVRQAGMSFAHVLISPGSPLRKVFRQIGTCVTLPLSREPYYLIARRLQETTPAILFDLNYWDCLGGDIL